MELTFSPLDRNYIFKNNNKNHQQSVLLENSSGLHINRVKRYQNLFFKCNLVHNTCLKKTAKTYRKESNFVCFQDKVIVAKKRTKYAKFPKMKKTMVDILTILLKELFYFGQSDKQNRHYSFKKAEMYLYLTSSIYQMCLILYNERVLFNSCDITIYLIACK